MPSPCSLSGCLLNSYLPENFFAKKFYHVGNVTVSNIPENLFFPGKLHGHELRDHREC